MIVKKCKYCKKEFKVFPCRKNTAKYCSKKCHAIGSFGEKGYWLGKKRPEIKNWFKCPPEISRKNLMEYMKKHSAWNKNKTLSYKHRFALSEAHKGQKPWNYKGGIKSLYDKIRWSFQYKEWRKSVLERDKYTCIYCGLKSERGTGQIHADHIKPFAFFPELRFDINNGRTLCISCHKKTETYGHNNYAY